MNVKSLSVLIVVAYMSGGCSIKVAIDEPIDGATVNTPTFMLQSEIRSSGRCMGGERCGHVDWVLEVDGVTACSGTGTGGTGTYSWCANRMGEYCIFHWDNVNSNDLGSGKHELAVKASATCHRDGSDSISINVP
jgi:hypothetical protein